MRKVFLNSLASCSSDQAWRSVVTEGDPKWIDQAIARAARHPNEPYAGVGVSLASLRKRGATDAEITDLVRGMQAELLFQLCHLLDDPGDVDADVADVTWALVQTDEDGNVLNTVGGLHESVLEQDPTGREMRPRGDRLTWCCSGRSSFLASLGRMLAAEHQVVSQTIADGRVEIVIWSEYGRRSRRSSHPWGDGDLPAWSGEVAPRAGHFRGDFRASLATRRIDRFRGDFWNICTGTCGVWTVRISWRGRWPLSIQRHGRGR